mgnify:CR=1 FL=1|jgi:hypothetical protein
MIKFFTQLRHRLQAPAISVYFNLLGFKAKLKWLISRKYKVIKSNDITNQKREVVVFALYQKTKFRKDVINLLEVLRARGAYVVGVNTQKIDESNKDMIEKYFDVYIERYNFGRDFGSYKTAFTKVIYKNINKSMIDKVLMINDSVYYSSLNLTSFVDSMMNSSFEVAGATENFDIQHHVGSFCIKIDSNIIFNAKLIKYWASYVMNDVRPRVIKKGELGLSKVLLGCVSNESNFGAVFGSKLLMEKLLKEKDQFLFNNIQKLTRQNSNVHWKTFTIQDLFQLTNQNIFNKYAIQNTHTHGSTTNLRMGDASVSETSSSSSNTILSDPDRDKSSAVFNLEDLKNFLKGNLNNYDDDDHEGEIHEKIAHYWYLVFREGSQIHQNAALLLYLGCPMIKMDGTLRGFWTSKEIEPMRNFMSPEEFDYISKKLYGKNNLGESLIGWKHVAFLKGYI